MSVFKIAAAQIAAARGNLEQNVARHAEAIAVAAEHHVSVVIFPELSLTGYEPDLAATLALSESDHRLAPLLSVCRESGIDVVLGAPLRNGADKPWLGAIWVSRQGVAGTYRKMHLGGDEPEFFAPGAQPLAITLGDQTIGLGICADASQISHPQTYAIAGAGIYAAGVFLTETWFATDAPRLASYAARFRMLVAMANHGASTGRYASVGKSAIWAPDGTLLVQAEGSEPALLMATRESSMWRGSLARL